MNNKMPSTIRMFQSRESKALVVAFLDILSMVVVNYTALWIRYDFHIRDVPDIYMSHSTRFLPIYIATTLVLYFLFHLYHSIWRFVGAAEMVRASLAYIVLAPILLIEQLFINAQYNMAGMSYSYLPRSYYLLIYVLNLMCCIGIRLSYRFLLSALRVFRQKRRGMLSRIMIIGGGEAARSIIRELAVSNEADGTAVCVIDDNVNKWNLVIEGVPIVGGRYDIPEIADKYDIDQIIYAIPSADAHSRREILHICTETGCRVKALPAIYQLLNGEVSVSRLKDVEITDLLGREEVRVNNAEISNFLQDRVVMVTGGGGSIGSELCRQIAAAEPKQLIVFDIYENNAYDIQQELKRDYPYLDLVVLIGSVRNTNRVNAILSQYKPYIVFHAAAHKHVPLMEDSPNEAIKNNVLGTYKLSCAAAENGVKKFLLISTDKAVNPTNIMGASKRLCEMTIQMMDRRFSDTDFMAVRFGNVLGSNGSVVPLFKQQIASGGPVTVTDKNIIRYFMTIPEAVSLVLQAGCYGCGGEIFVLDMGEPVRIDDMARNLIRLSGFEPDVDIPVVYTGLRPGEKLYEEFLMDEEGMQRTANSRIFIGHPIEMDDEAFEAAIHRLDEASRGESDNIKKIVSEIVPTYRIS